jgi:hypothetical protein
MNHDTLSTALTLSTYIGIPLGLLLFVWWYKKVFGRLVKNLEKSKTIHLEVVAIKALFYSFPGLVLFIACSVPALYFNYLLKQEDYCKQFIEVNKGIKKDDADLIKRCGALDIDALFKSSKP